MSDDTFVRPDEDKPVLQKDRTQVRIRFGNEDAGESEEREVIEVSETGSSSDNENQSVSAGSQRRRQKTTPMALRLAAENTNSEHKLVIIAWCCVFGYGIYYLGDCVGGRDGSLLQLTFWIVLFIGILLLWIHKRRGSNEPLEHRQLFLAAPCVFFVGFAIWFLIRLLPESVLSVKPVSTGMDAWTDSAQALAYVLIMYCFFTEREKKK